MFNCKKRESEGREDPKEPTVIFQFLNYRELTASSKNGVVYYTKIRDDVVFQIKTSKVQKLCFLGLGFDSSQ